MRKRSLAALLAFSLAFTTVMPAMATEPVETVAEIQTEQPAGIVDGEGTAAAAVDAAVTDETTMSAAAADAAAADETTTSAADAAAADETTTDVAAADAAVTNETTTDVAAANVAVADETKTAMADEGEITSDPMEDLISDDVLFDEEPMEDGFAEDEFAEEPEADFTAEEMQIMVEDIEVVDTPAVLAEETGSSKELYVSIGDKTTVAGESCWLSSSTVYASSYDGTEDASVAVKEWKVLTNEVKDEAGNWVASDKVIGTIEYDEEDGEYYFYSRDIGRAQVEVTYYLDEAKTETGTATVYVYAIEEDYDLDLLRDLDRTEILPGETASFRSILYWDRFAGGEYLTTEASDYTLKVEEPEDETEMGDSEAATVKIGEDGKTVLLTAAAPGYFFVRIGAYLEGKNEPVAVSSCWVDVVDGYYEIRVSETENVPLCGALDWNALNPQLFYVSKSGETQMDQGKFTWEVSYDGWEKIDPASQETFPQLRRMTSYGAYIYLYANGLPDEDGDTDELAYKSIRFESLDEEDGVSLTAKYGDEQYSAPLYTDEPQVFTLDLSKFPQDLEYDIKWSVTKYDEELEKTIPDPDCVKYTVSEDKRSITLEAVEGHDGEHVDVSAEVYYKNNSIANAWKGAFLRDAVCELEYRYDGEWLRNQDIYFEENKVNVFVQNSKYLNGRNMPSEIVNIEFGTPGILKDTRDEYVRRLTCVANGTTTVTLTLKNEELWGNELKPFTFTVTVKDEIYNFYFIFDNSILFLNDTKKLETNLNLSLSEAPFYKELSQSDYTVTYTSSNPEVIEVTEDGQATGKKLYQSAIITAVAYVGGEEVASCSQDFYVQEDLYSIDWGDLYSNLMAGNEFTITPTLTYYSPEYKEGKLVSEGVTYKIYQDPEVLEIDGLKVKVPEDAEGQNFYFEMEAWLDGTTVAGMSSHFVIRSGHAHVWDSGTVTKQANCTEAGEKTYHCTVENCGLTRKETIPAAGHKWDTGTVTKQAACTAAGEKTYTCASCKQTKKEAIPATGHNWGSGKVTSPATVLADAIETRSCLNPGCTAKESYSVPGTKLKASITVPESNVKLKQGQSTTALNVTMTEGDSVVSVKSSNEKLLKVSNINKTKGTLKLKAGKKSGKVKLTITLASGKKKTVTVNVQAKNVTTTKIKVTKKLTIAKGKSATLKPEIKPITSQDKVKYKSSNTKIATVSAKGVIKAKAKGKVTITVTSGKKKATCKVTVK